MTFVTVSDRQEQLVLLSKMLISTFPGCTIHQSHNSMQAVKRMTHRKVDAVFADGNICSELMGVLSMQQYHPSVYFLCGQDLSRREVPTGVCGVVTHPVTECKIRNLFTTQKEIQ